MKTHIVSYQDDAEQFIAYRKDDDKFSLSEKEDYGPAFLLTYEGLLRLRDFLSELLSEEM